ncbi:MAG: PstS family phosphate ABC transporter substrate-binding protein [Bacillota bacterium]
MKKLTALLVLLLSLSLIAAGCGGGKKEEASKDNKAADKKLAGAVKIDGSSTVFPITEAVAEEFKKVQPGVNVTVGISGTGGGFKKFTAGETDISNASRPIKDNEKKMAEEKKIEYIEFPVAYDGISVVVNKQNTWVDKLTVQELKKIWEPGSKVKKWSEVRPGWPDVDIKLYGPGTDSGTFDYFTEAINGKEKACRSDFTPSEDDNVLVQGVSGDKGALGYFGYAYYAENKDKLKVVPIDAGKGPVTPEDKTINDGTYKPLSRPIFIYVSKASLQRPEVREFVKFYLTSAPKLVQQVGYTRLPDNFYSDGLAKVK